jgi:hypothetical protein
LDLGDIEEVPQYGCSDVLQVALSFWNEIMDYGLWKYFIHKPLSIIHHPLLLGDKKC